MDFAKKKKIEKNNCKYLTQQKGKRISLTIYQETYFCIRSFSY